VADAFHFGAGI
jgi:RNA polymerase sigma factor (sigma-70 family)